MKNNKKIKMFGIILGVVFVGVGLLDLGLLYILGDELELSSCEFCFELNPQIADCKNYKPINFSNLTIINIPFHHEK